MPEKPKCPHCKTELGKPLATKTLLWRSGTDGKDGAKASGDYKCPKCRRTITEQQLNEKGVKPDV